MNYKCRRATCNVLLDAPGFCLEHQDQARTRRDETYDRSGRRDAEAKRFYASKAWRQARLIYLSANPLCEHCRNAEAELVHHKRPAKQLGPMERLDPLNFQSLCWSCHSRLESKRARTGDPNAELDSFVPIDWEALRLRRTTPGRS